jgi:FAD/FMN-containing dehydrogenase
MSGIPYLNPADLVATVQAGTTWKDLRSALADRGAWLPLDPPGVVRTVGSVTATATAGPLRTGFGTIRDQLLGLTVVTGDGRIIRAGGKVVKNVAGFDIPKLAAGSFGAFGIITSVHLRLRTVPRADLTLRATGKRDDLLHAALAILERGHTPAALELLSPRASGAGQWVLGARLLGSDSAVSTEHVAVQDAAAPITFHPLAAADATEFWQSMLERATDAPVTLRLGVVTTALDEALDAIAHHLDEKVGDWIAVNALGGAIRWSGDARTEDLRLLRHVAAQREIPVTLERAPWNVRQELGHFGAYREGVARLIGSITQIFDAAGVLVVPLGETR